MVRQQTPAFGVALAAVFTRDDGRMVFSTRHLTDAPLFKVLHGPGQPRLEDEGPVAELPVLPQAEGDQPVL